MTSDTTLVPSLAPPGDQPASSQGHDNAAPSHSATPHPTSRGPTRIAAVAYLNTRPLIEGLEKLSDCTVIRTVPAAIIGLLQSDQADIGLASVIDALAMPMTLIPSGMIGCDGPTLTVRLFSRVPLHAISVLHADIESHTSVVLARILLAKQFSIHPSIEPFTAPAQAAAGGIRSGWPESFLLIGDKVVTQAPQASSYPHQLDLGAAWKEHTGLPFVYAMWMCKTSTLQGVGGTAIRLAAQLLSRQRQHNQTRLDWIVETYATQSGWPRDLARTYLGSLLHYRVGARERQAVEAFLSAAMELNLVPRRSVEWMSDLSPSEAQPTPASRGEPK